MKQIWTDRLKLNKVCVFLLAFVWMISTSSVSVLATEVEATTVSATATEASVAINGTVEVGQVLTTTLTNVDATATITYQWLRGTTNIDGATGNSYTITADDAGSVLQVNVTIVTVDTTSTLSGTTSVVPEVDPDIATVNTAKSQVESAVFLDPTKESDYTDEAAIIAYATKLATASIDDSSVTISVQTVKYTPAVAGTLDNVSGTSGSYEFAVTVSKGVQSATTGSRTFSVPASAYVPTVYEVTSGSGQEIELGSEVAVTFATNGDVADFQGLYCNGVLVSADNYSVAEDAVTVTLSAAYVKALAAGSQEFTLAFADGTVSVPVAIVDPEEEVVPEVEDTTDVPDTSTSDSDTSSTDEVVLEEEEVEEEVEEPQEEVEEEEFETEFLPADEPEEEQVVEPDDVDMNILWVVLLLIVVAIIAEIFFVRRKRRPLAADGEDEEVDDDLEEEVEDHFEEEDNFGDETGFEDMDNIEEIDN